MGFVYFEEVVKPSPNVKGEENENSPLETWITEDILKEQISRTGPHSAQDISLFFSDKMYKEFEPPEWENFDENYSDKPYGHLRKHQEWNLEDKDWEWWKDIARMYYAGVSYVDYCCGRIFDALDKLGMKENTMILFTADHADPTGMHKHFEKGGTMFDEVMRIPLIVSCPCVVPNGERREGFVRNMDICPTLIDIVGENEMLWEMDAKSFTGAWNGKKYGYDSVYAE